MLKIAITGANGFVGQKLCQILLSRGDVALIKVCRRNSEGYEDFINLQTTPAQEITKKLKDFDCLIHLAARAHTNNSTAEDFQRDNLQLSTTMAEIARDANIKQVIYLSSIKVLGNSTSAGRPFKAGDTPKPEDLYGQSKLDSEDAIKYALKDSNTWLTIIRPPLVWGEGCKGNLRFLIRLIDRGIPLPFGAINNGRDIISLNNLCSFITHLIANPTAKDQTFLVSDGVSRSTREIVELLEIYAQRKAIFINVPGLIFKLLKQIPILKPKISSIFDNLEVDITETTSTTSWKPLSQ